MCYAHGSLEIQDAKTPQKIAIWAPSHKFVGLYLHNEGMYRQSEKSSLNSNICPTCPHNMVNFAPLAAEICWRVWGTPVNFKGFLVLAALLHGTLVVGVSQTVWRWTEVGTYIRQGDQRALAHILVITVLQASAEILCCLVYWSAFKR